MNYEACQTLDELIADSDATEFRENIEYMPFDQTKEQFFDWLNLDALPNWGDDYKLMLQALSRLVSAADFTLAMAQLKVLQTQLKPAPVEKAPEKPEKLEKPPEVPAPPAEAILAPKEAAQKVAEAVAAPIIKEFQEQYSDFVARLTPEQLRGAALEGAAAAVSQGGKK